MCNYIDNEHIMPGWTCCKCHTYNDLSRKTCRECTNVVCTPLLPDTLTGCIHNNRIHQKGWYPGTEHIEYMKGCDPRTLKDK